MIVDGVTSASVTVAGHVTLGTVDRGSFQVTLYWSKDAVLDDYDVDSGKTRIYLLGGHSIMLRNFFLEN